MNLQDSSKKKSINILFLICLTVIMTISYYYYHFNVGISSDTTTLIPMAKDILNGNVFLSNWILGSNNFYFTDIIPNVIFLLLGFSDAFFIHAMPSIVYSVFTILTVAYAFDLHENLKTKALPAIMSFFIIGIVTLRASYTLLNGNSHNNLYVLITIGIILILKFFNSNKLIYLISYILLGSLSFFSDSETLMLLFAPVGCFAILFMLINKEIIKGLQAIFATGISFLAGKGIYFLFAINGGMTTRGLPFQLISPLNWFSRLGGFIKEYYILIGFDGFENIHLFSMNGLYNLTIALYMFILVLVFIYQTIFIFKTDYKQKIFYLISCINLAACVMTSVVIHLRYIAPFYLYSTVLVFMTLYDWYKILSQKTNQTKVTYAVKIICLAFGLVIAYPKVYAIAQTNTYGNEHIQVASLLKDKGWTKGYGDFFSASLVSYYSEDQVSLYPIITLYNEEHACLLTYPELIKTTWHPQTDVHVIVSQCDGDAGYYRSDIISILGEPDETYEISPYLIQYWEKDISEYFLY